MNINPKVSFLIPCYNAAPFLEKALSCVINQTYKNLEIITIDDGSTDNTLDILNNFAAKDKRVKIIKNNPNIGLIKTLNLGLDEVSGEYIARFDADDLIELNRIELQIKELLNDPTIDLLTSKAVYITENDSFFSKVDQTYCTLPLSIKLVSLFDSPFLHAGIIIKTHILQKHKFNFNKESIHIEDYDLFSRLISDNIKIKVNTSKELLYKYRRNTNSVSFQFRSLQSYNAAQLSKKNIFQSLNYIIDDMQHQIINLNTNKEHKITQLNDALSSFNIIVNQFMLQHVSFISNIEKQEIMNWVKLKKFKILLVAMIKGNLFLKIQTLLLIFKNINIIFSMLVIEYISNRIIWLKSYILNRK